MDNASVKEATLAIDRLAFGGEGVGRIEGKVVFVPWTVPGDTVRVRIVKEENRFSRAELVEVIEASPERVKPRCSVFGVCGGCQWQQLNYPAQLKAKEAIVRESLERIGKIAALPLQPIIPCQEPWQYRSRIQLKRDREGRIGYLEAASHTVVEFDQCEIANPIFNEAVRQIRSDHRKLPFAFELLAENHDVVVRDLEDPDRVFSQVNPEVNRRLTDVVLNLAFGRAEIAFCRRLIMVELYSGAGNFTFPLAEKAGKVFAVEENAAAIRQAEKQMVSAGLTGIEFIGGSAEWGVKKIQRRNLPMDLVGLDPPRQGAKEILDLLCVIHPRVLIYISCDPTTLARDLKFLLARHYQLETVQPLDMFPQTYHIETVVKLVRKNGG